MLFCPVLHLIAGLKIESGCQWKWKRVRKTECQCEPITGSVIQDSKSRTGWLKQRLSPAIFSALLKGLPSILTLLFYLFTQHINSPPFFLLLIYPLLPCSSDSWAQATTGTPWLSLGSLIMQMALLCLRRPHAQEGFKKERERHLAPLCC